MNDYICRVCGLDLQSLPELLALNNNEGFYQPDGYATCEICPCCGSESGYEDTSIESAQKNRQRWVSEGCPWISLYGDKFKPPNWDPKKQLEQIPPEWQ